ncbi:MAG: hypothetical protein IJU71_02630 [Selenomonadaceae bacterium]|nr:hypothetical protein [Selenomonadaceae bacterium]
MRRELSVDEIHRAKDFVKGNGDQLITNFFVADAELDKIIKRNQLKYSFSDKTLIAVRKSAGFSRLYFFTVDADDFIISLRSLLPTIERPIASELFIDHRNADQVEDVQRNLLELGFHHHATQTRLTKIVSTNEYGEIESEWYARADDCDEIMEILLQDFDPLCDQLPEQDELLDRIANREVLVARNGDRIASVIMFKRGAAVADWIFWVTRPEERSSFHGLRLRDEYLKLVGKVRRQVLYVREEKMQRFHQRFGFRVDGFENRVFVIN